MRRWTCPPEEPMGLSCGRTLTSSRIAPTRKEVGVMADSARVGVATRADSTIRRRR